MTIIVLTCITDYAVTTDVYGLSFSTTYVVFPLVFISMSIGFAQELPKLSFLKDTGHYEGYVDHGVLVFY